VGRRTELDERSNCSLTLSLSHSLSGSIVQIGKAQEGGYHKREKKNIKNKKRSIVQAVKDRQFEAVFEHPSILNSSLHPRQFKKKGGSLRLRGSSEGEKRAKQFD